MLVLAAASTADAVREVADAYTRQTGVEVVISAAGSNALASQIIAGAPAAIFLSASREWASAVVDAGRAVESTPLLTNELVLVVPAGNLEGVSSPADLFGESVSHVALAGESVPAGQYARQSLSAAGVYERLVDENRIARAEDVRQAMSFVEAGAAEAGVVYATDAAASERVEVAYRFPPDTHDAIIYPLVRLKDTDPAAREFFQFLKSEAASAIFREYGFSPAKGGAE